MSLINRSPTSMLYYIPNSIELPVESKLDRVFPKQVRRNGKSVAQDTRTIFYDLTISRKENRLVGVGPPLYNLRRELFPVQVFVDGALVKYQIKEIRSQFILRSERLNLASRKSVQIILKFRCFQKKITLDVPEAKCIALNKNARISISAIQKNNRVEWIRDWILWHRRLYDVQRVILYDNGSSNRNEVIDMLRSLESEVTIIFVDWNFLYGGAPYNCAQVGALNHCRTVFGDTNDEQNGFQYCINLDIDEYLVYLADRKLADYLDSTIGSSFQFATHIQEMRVPNLSSNIDSSRISRCFDFEYRFRNFGSNPTLLSKQKNNIYMKYIYRFGSDFYNDVHSIVPFSYRVTNFTTLKRFIYLMKLKFIRRVWSIRCQFGIGDVEYPKIQYHMQRSPNYEIYFFHFQGLSTNWKEEDSKRPTVFDGNLHIKEVLITCLAKKAKLDSEFRD